MGKYEPYNMDWCDHCSMDCEYDERGNCEVCGNHIHDFVEEEEI